VSKMAILMSHMEGFGVPGSIPTVRNNPLDLRHGPNASHPPDDPDGIGYYDSPELGWQDGERQLRLYADRRLTVSQAINEFAPPSENNTQAYLDYVCEGLGCTSDALVSSVLDFP